jgi:endonuclease-3
LHPTDSLMATILSQHTADRNSSEAFRRLKARYSSWEDVAVADRGALEETIRPAGLAASKARHIQEALLEIDQRFGSMDLGFLRNLDMQEARDILVSLPGVGPKTAACVLLFACDLPALPVDTHVHRLAGRLELIGPGASAERAHIDLAPLVAPEDVYDFHVGLIAHGRRICSARDPRCGECILHEICPQFGSGAWN